MTSLTTSLPPSSSSSSSSSSFTSPTPFNSTSSFTTSSLITSYNATTSFNASTSTASPTTTTAQSQQTNLPDILKPPPGSIASSAKQNQSGLTTQLIICGSIGLLCFLLFCFLRTRWPIIFAPRKSMKRRKPPSLPDTFFGWILPLLRISKTEMLDKVGLDAVIMLDFIVMGIKIFSLCSFFGVVVLIPISTTTGNFTDPLLNPVDHLSITVVNESSPYLIAYLVFTYFFTIITWFFLQQNYHSYVYMRARYLLQLSNSLVCRSVIVTGLPEELRTDEALANYFENLGVGVVVSCHVVRHVKKLGHILRQRARTLDKLEEAYARYWGNPCTIDNYHPDLILQESHRIHNQKKVAPTTNQDQTSTCPTTDDDDESINDEPIPQRTNKVIDIPNNNSDNANPIEKCKMQDTIMELGRRPQVRLGFLGLFGEKVDAIDHYSNMFDYWDKKAIEARASPEFDMTSVGFVTFEKMGSAMIASQIAINPVPFRCRTANAYEPRDVLWKNIHVSGKQRVVRDILVWSATTALVVFWTVPISFISSFTSIEAIIKVAPGLGDFINGHKVLQNIIQGLVPTVLVNIFMQLLPLILDYLGVLQGLRARSAISESTLSKYFFFLIFNVLLVFTIVSTALNTLVILFERPTEIAQILASSLPKVSPFFINYTILQGLLLMPLNLLLLGSLIVRGFSIYFLAKTPRNHANARSPDAFNYGSSYPQPLLIFIIVLEYSTIAPAICVFGTLYFVMAYIVFKYQFLYVYFRPYEAAGHLWTMVFPRIIVGMILFQLTMLGLFILKDSYVLGAFCVPLVVLTLIFKYTIDAAYFRNSFHLPMQLLREQEKVELFSSRGGNDLNNYSNMNGNNTLTEKPIYNPRDRWALALGSIQNTTRQRFDKSDSQQQLEQSSSQPRQRRVILDEDNYKATPDNKTDYRQPPMYLNPGVLDTGLKWYGNPYLVGELPQLWLPVKANEQTYNVPASGQSTGYSNTNNQELNLRRQQSSTTAMDVAQVVRQMEKAYQDSKELNQVCVHDSSQQGSGQSSFFGQRFGALASFGSFGSFLPHDQFSPRQNSTKGNNESDDDDDDDDDDGKSASVYHRIYYHHPDQRHSSSSTNRLPSSSTHRIHSSPSPLLNSTPNSTNDIP
ncbi:hypothetical protein BC941DRAFT_497389 [Chlamydoabsidia padenii]|nr:hypothetical protein BC941DRAFT_497389 [Chlamydoabsidia padenii]